MNFRNIMQQAQKMQKELQNKISQFDAKEFEYNYQNSIQIKIKGDLTITSIKITDVLVDPEDKMTLEQMVQEAINEAVSKTQEKKNQLTSASLPSGFGF